MLTKVIITAKRYKPLNVLIKINTDIKPKASKWLSSARFISFLYSFNSLTIIFFFIESFGLKNLKKECKMIYLNTFRPNNLLTFSFFMKLRCTKRGWYKFIFVKKAFNNMPAIQEIKAIEKLKVICLMSIMVGFPVDKSGMLKYKTLSIF